IPNRVPNRHSEQSTKPSFRTKYQTVIPNSRTVRNPPASDKSLTFLGVDMRFRLLPGVCACVAIAALAVPALSKPDHKKHKKNPKELRHALHEVKVKIHEKKVALRATKRKERNISAEIAS